MEPIYRTADVGDAAALAALAALAFTETFGHLYDPADLALFLERHTEETWRSLLESQDATVRLAEVARTAIAYALIEPPNLPFEPKPGALEIGQFYVLAPWHGTGTSAKLMQWAMAEVRARGGNELYLSVFVKNLRARRFYERHGFEIVGRHVFMVGTHADEDLIMRRALKGR